MKLLHVSKKIERKTVIENIHFEMGKNEIIGLVGRNGSGKTTLFRTISGQYQLDQGDITIESHSIIEDENYRKEIFFLDEKEHFLNAYPLKKIGQIYQAAYPSFNYDSYLNLTNKFQLMPSFMYKQLSKGMQGLYRMILAITSGAKFLLLDEPFDGLDVITRKQVITLLLEHVSEGEHSVIISSHNLVELEKIVDRVLLLKNHTIEKNYHLESMREQAKKIQMVFKTKKVPELIKQHSRAIQFQGRVVTAIFENYTPELANEIKALQPILFEELPLTLEDLFEANLINESPTKGMTASE